MVSWPAALAGFTLQQSLDLGQSAAWTPVVVPVTTSGGSNSVTLPLTNTVQFFRLKQ